MIESNQLTRFFGSKKAVDSVSFQVKKGEILGFLGPNGAGKSTTMRMLTGYLTPTSGDALIEGVSISEKPIKVKSKIGYLSETSPLYPEMTVNEFLNFCLEIRGFRGKEKDKKRNIAIDKCSLKDVENQQINTLSKGYRQRVSFAQSIIHDPDYLILDEPTDGLDPNQKHEVREMIKSMSSEKGIILSTHILEEAQAVCTRAIIISQGKIISDDTPAGLCKKDPDYGSFLMEINSSNSSENPVKIIENIEYIEKIKTITQNEELKKLCIRIFPLKNYNDSVSKLMNIIEGKITSSGCIIDSISIDNGDLTKVFRLLTSGN
ncbi:MAG: ABC transporter ATP-binding protein [Deltaproteobacteria bacterium]|nr:MAG: ABC transporter ATP-binding protein [Deltaproteobacteria bacterium]